MPFLVGMIVKEKWIAPCHDHVFSWVDILSLVTAFLCWMGEWIEYDHWVAKVPAIFGCCHTDFLNKAIHFASACDHEDKLIAARRLANRYGACPNDMIWPSSRRPYSLWAILERAAFVNPCAPTII